jgi:hypothetical protein
MAGVSLPLASVRLDGLVKIVGCTTEIQAQCLEKTESKISVRWSNTLFPFELTRHGLMPLQKKHLILFPRTVSIQIMGWRK